MQNIVLLMQRQAIVSNLKSKLNEHNGLNVIYQSDYEQVKKTQFTNVDVFLIEVAESGKFDIDYCLNLTKIIRELYPKCKLLLMCSDHDEECISLVLKAKREGLIDDFVFYDVTIDYLSSKLLAL